LVTNISGAVGAATNGKKKTLTRLEKGKIHDAQ
jgi:hypothetical protein